MPSKKQILVQKIKKKFNLINLTKALLIWKKFFPFKRLNYISFRYHAHNSWSNYFIKLGKEILIEESEIPKLKYNMDYLVLPSNSSDCIN